MEGRKVQLGSIKQIFLHEAGGMISVLCCAGVGSCRCPMVGVVAAWVRNGALTLTGWYPRLGKRWRVCARPGSAPRDCPHLHFVVVFCNLPR